MDAKLTKDGPVMLNFMCQLDWAKDSQVVVKT